MSLLNLYLAVQYVKNQAPKHQNIWPPESKSWNGPRMLVKPGILDLDQLFNIQ